MTWKYGDPMYITFLTAKPEQDHSGNYTVWPELDGFKRWPLVNDHPNYPPPDAAFWEVNLEIPFDQDYEFDLWGIGVVTLPVGGRVLGVCDAKQFGHVVFYVGDSLSITGKLFTNYFKWVDDLRE